MPLRSDVVVLFDLPLWMVLIFLFVLGASIGSFLNVCIYRLPQHEQVWKSLKGLSYPPSTCPYCRKRIRPRDNIPILGWFLIRGRCRDCKRAIGFRYPAIELLNGLLFIGLYYLEVPSHLGATMSDSIVSHAWGPTGDWRTPWFSPVAVLHWRYAFHMVLIELLLVATFIDFDLRIIPDSVTVPGMIAGILGQTVLGCVYLVPVWGMETSVSSSLLDMFQVTPPGWLEPVFSTGKPDWITAHPHWHGLANSLAGFVVGGGVVWLVRIIGHFVLKQEAMGFGDVTLMAMMGSFLGWQPVLVVFFLAPVCALVAAAITSIVLPQREIPYGPYLSLGALALLIGWKYLWEPAERIFEFGPLLPVLALGMAALLYLLLTLTRFLRQRFGWEPLEENPVGEWTSADQLSYQAAERTDLDQGQWSRPGWPGRRSGDGSLQHETWRHSQRGTSASGWQDRWQRQRP